MSEKEAKARVLINRMLENAGWRFFEKDGKPANIQLEQGVELRQERLDELGENFERVERGFIDFLLLDSFGRPLVVLEAKAPNKDPLIGKEQAREYAKSVNCRFVILSNGLIHYLWDLRQGNPQIITTFPSPESLENYRRFQPDPQRLIDEEVKEDYIVLSQMPDYQRYASYQQENTRQKFIQENKLRFLRDYQIQAIRAVQNAVKEKKTRFLLEMATGTGKTLVAAAVTKLFLKTQNAYRVLFLVDRVELERQAMRALKEYFRNGYHVCVYKENREDWRMAEIVISTIQTFLFNNRFMTQFSPTDFDLVISDEAHRSIGGKSRQVFEYFTGYKLGLTATPKDYLRNLDQEALRANDPRELERRILLDTYKTFGCENSEPTFRYSLLDGVRDGILINPVVIDARTEVTTQLLSDEGYIVHSYEDVAVDIEEYRQKEKEEIYRINDFEKRFFSIATNELFCKTFIEKALKDPITNEIGKSIVFCVSQNHASKITQILNQIAHRVFPNIYQSDFAVQVTSMIPNAQQFTVDFANNKLNGHSQVVEGYLTSKTRVCVTVGMMTTGYDCTDILNIVMMRPIFSPTDFIQIKGRGTRTHDFSQGFQKDEDRKTYRDIKKTKFLLFDFFGNFEYFEEDYQYDEVIQLPPVKRPPWSESGDGGNGDSEDQPRGLSDDTYVYTGEDIISTIQEQPIGLQGMRIDREFFQSFEDKVKSDEAIVKAVEEGQWDQVIEYVNQRILNQPKEHYTLENLRRAAEVDRHITIKEILEKIFGLIPKFKSKNELLEEEFAKFVAQYIPPAESVPAIKYFFKAYITSEEVRNIVKRETYGDFANCSEFTFEEFKQVPENFRRLIPDYINESVPIQKFVA